MNQSTASELVEPRASSAPLEPGEIVGGRFVIEHLAGRGGMGSVYRALDTSRNEPVALKILLDRDDDGRARFEREARVLAGLVHPGIARYVTHGVAKEGYPYLATAWLEGEDLATRLRRKPLDVGESLLLVQKVAETLEAVHVQGVVHRDIKPQNLFLPAGRVFDVTLLDFGIARLTTAMQVLTQKGAILGTASYMAPEQIRGRSEVGPRADLYALGCVLFECLVGHPPFEAAHPVAVLTKALFDDPRRVSDCVPTTPPWLDDLVAQLLKKDPLRRPRSARDVATMLAEASFLDPPDEESPGHVSSVPPLLGSRERRLVCIVLIAPPPREAPKLAFLPIQAEEATLRIQPGDIERLAERFSARLEPLGRGHFAALLRGAPSAHDLAVRGGHLARGLRKHLPSARIVVALGRDDAGGTQSMGEVIDRAAALLPDTNQTVLDEPCARLLTSRFVVTPAGSQFLLTGGIASMPPPASLEQPAPFIVRERETSLLVDLFENTVEEAQASVALVTAPAGAGKARLREELLRRVGARGEPVEIWSASGNPMSAGSAFAMISAAARSAFGIASDEEAVAACAKISAFVARWIEGASTARVSRFLGELLGFPFPDDDEQLFAARRDVILMGNQIRRAAEDLFAAICAERPVLLVFEDLHWGDVATIKLVDGVLRHLANAPLCVLAFASPEIDDVLPGAWSERNVQRIRLAPLARKVCMQMAREALGERATEEVIARIVERAGGNTFLLKELIRGEKRGEGDVFPETVLAMAQLRIEQLDAEARRVLRVASLFGGSFGQSALSALLGPEAEGLDTVLSRLVDKKVLVFRRAERSNEPSYAFRHAYLRDAAYEMLTVEDRGLGHLRIALQLEQKGQGDVLVIAQHFERGGAPARAVRGWTRGVEEAITGNDLEGAVARGLHALALDSAPAATGPLHLLLSTAHCWLGRFEEADRHATAALEALEVGTAEWYAAAERLSWALNALGMNDLLSSLQAWIATAEPVAGRSSERVIAWLALAEVDYLNSNFASGDELLTRATRLAVHCEASASLDARVTAIKAIRENGLNRLGSAVVLFSRAVELYTRVGDLRNAVIQMVNKGSACLSLGAHAKAERLFREALAHCRRLGLRSQEAWVEHSLGRALALQGKSEEGLAMMRGAVNELQKIDYHRLWLHGSTELAWILVLLGHLEEADRRSSDVLDGDMSDNASILAQAVRARVKLDRGDAAGALESARIAAGLQESTGDREHVAAVYVTLALALAASGAQAEAELACRKARDGVMAVAASLDEPAQRRMFLDDVPNNRHALGLAQSWFIV